MTLTLSRTLLLCLLAGMLCACMTPPVSWQHDPGEPRFEPSGYSMVIEPIEDARPIRNDEPSFWRWVPGVLWVTEDDQMFDLVLMREGSRRQSQPNEAMRFDASEDLPRAMREQLGTAGLLGPVFVSERQLGTLPEERNLRLQLKIDELSIKRRYQRYALGPLAPLAHLFGAPTQRLEVVCRYSLEVFDAQETSLYYQYIDQNAYEWDGWYEPLDAEQRALYFISFSLGESLDRMQDALDELLTSHHTKGE